MRTLWRAIGCCCVVAGVALSGFYAAEYWDYRSDAMGAAVKREMEARPDPRMTGMPFTQEVMNEQFRRELLEHFMKGFPGIVLIAVGGFLLWRTRDRSP
jgi:hypothetical protein